MILCLKLCIAVLCGWIAFEDFKFRAVNWFLFVLFAVCLALLHRMHLGLFAFLLSSAINVTLVLIVILILYLYTRFVVKKTFLNVSFGLGDFFFLLAFAFGFPTVSFIVLFTGGVFFALFISQANASIKSSGSIPLAGLIGIFLGVTLLTDHWMQQTYLFQF